MVFRIAFDRFIKKYFQNVCFSIKMCLSTCELMPGGGKRNKVLFLKQRDCVF